jgi:hypothetical protein
MRRTTGLDAFQCAGRVTPFRTVRPSARCLTLRTILWRWLRSAISLDEKNTEKSYGAQLSKKMDFSDLDLAPMHLLNEIIWKSVKGADSPMPPPVHLYRPVAGVE